MVKRGSSLGDEDVGATNSQSNDSDGASSACIVPRVGNVRHSQLS